MTHGTRRTTSKGGKSRVCTPAATALLRRIRKSFLDSPDPDLQKEELARDEVVEEPSILYPLADMADDLALTLEQRSVIAGFAIDVAVGEPTDEKLVNEAIAIVIDFVLHVSAEPESIKAGGRLHQHLADSLALLQGDPEASDGYLRSTKKTLKALREFAAKAAKLRD